MCLRLAAYHAGNCAKALLDWGMTYAAICADAHAAVHAYQDLARLSQAELERRGIPRDQLHCVVFQIFEPMTMWPVSTRVIKPENDYPAILARADEVAG
jgi:hypothetical protein